MGPPIEHRPQRHAVDVLGGEKLDVAVMADVVDGQDVWMVERRNRSGLAFEPAQALFVAKRPVRQHFQREPAPQPDVLRKIDLGHPAGSERLEDSIVRQHVAGREYPLHAFTARVPPGIVTTAAAAAAR